MKDRISNKNLFTGGMDFDSDLTSVKENDYLRALNIRGTINEEGTFNIVSNIKGNTLVSYTLPPGYNKVIGAYEDMFLNTLIYFVCNEQTQFPGGGFHSILRYYPQTNSIVKIFEDSQPGIDVFDWTLETRITHVNLVEGKLLYWIDPKPRKINIEKATFDKPQTWKLVLLDSPVDVTHNIFDQNGTFLGSTPEYSSNADLDAYAGFLNSNPFYNQFFTAEACGDDYILVTAKNNLNYSYTVTSNPLRKAIAIPDNFYDPVLERTVYRGKFPLPCYPVITPINDSTKNYNLIKDKHFMFMARVIYDDNEKSVYSSVSDISLRNCAQSGFNGIRVEITDDTFNLQNIGSVQRVEIVAREGDGLDGAEFQRVKTFEQWELWSESKDTTVIYHDFFNDGNYETIGKVESLAPYDAVGRETYGQEFAADRLFDGHILENYNKPCPKVDVTASFTQLDNLNLYSISGLIKIWADDFWGAGIPGLSYICNLGDVDGESTYDVWGGSNFGTVAGSGNRGNPADFGQQLVHGGFTVYDAMNPDYFTISRQNTSHGLPVTSTGALSAGTQTERQNIISFIGNNGIFFSEWALRGMAPGSHVIRIASHWCSFGNLLEKGSMYDLNGRRFHTTSMPVKTFADQNGIHLGPFVYEIRVDIDTNGAYRLYSDQSSLPFASGVASVNNGIYAGEIIVNDNISVQDESDVRWCVDGYLIDGGGGSDNNVLATGGVFMERQLVARQEGELKPRPSGSLTPINLSNDSMITDHNGYFFFLLDGVNNWSSDFTTLSQAVAFFSAQSPNSLQISAISDNAIKLSQDLVKNSVLNDLYNSSITDNDRFITSDIGKLNFNGISTIFNNGDFNIQVLLYNTNPTVTQQNRVRIKGTVENNGVGLENMSVLYERNGRQEKTGAGGSFEIIAYSDYDSLIGANNVRNIDDLIVANPNSCAISFSGNPSFILLLEIAQFGGNPYGDSSFIQFRYSDFNVGIIAASLSGQYNRFLKGGGSYTLALLFTDQLKRRCDIIKLDPIYIPFITENRNKIEGVSNTLSSGPSDGFFTFSLNISGDVTNWATRLHVLRSLNANYNDYLQFPVFDVKYVVDFDGVDIVETTFETSTATEIWLDLTTALTAYQNKNIDSLKSYVFVEGDRMRLIADANGKLFSDNGSPALFDFKIKGQRGLGDSTYLIIGISDLLPKLDGGVLIEVYSPKLNIEEDFYYEIHTCELISDPIQITLDTGDTYRRNRIALIDSGTQPVFIEDASISDFYLSKYQDIGRPSISNPDFKEILRTNVIRFSGKYYEDTKVNNLSTFGLADAEQTPKRLGAINALRISNDDNYRQVLLAIHENNTASVYIGDVLFSDVSGEDVIALSSKVLGAIRILKGDFGTTNPESVASRDGRVYWWDDIRKRFIRYSLNGLTPISDYGIRSFRPSVDQVEGIWDVYHEQYIATLFKQRSGTIISIPLRTLAFISIDTEGFEVGDTVYVNGLEGNVVALTTPMAVEFNIAPGLNGQVQVIWKAQTIIWDENRNKWVCYASFTPECYGTVDDKLISFKNGELWTHDTNNLRNNFYGVQYFSYITLVFNINPHLLKLWFNMRMQANSKWSSPQSGDISLPPNASYPTGMISRLKPDNIELIEGQYWSSFLKDQNDPAFTNTLEALLRGRDLRGEVMQVRLENTSTDKATLRLIEAFMADSNLTEP